MCAVEVEVQVEAADQKTCNGNGNGNDCALTGLEKALLRLPNMSAQRCWRVVVD